MHLSLRTFSVRRKQAVDSHSTKFIDPTCVAYDSICGFISQQGRGGHGGGRSLGHAGGFLVNSPPSLPWSSTRLHAKQYTAEHRPLTNVSPPTFRSHWPSLCPLPSPYSYLRLLRILVFSKDEPRGVAIAKTRGQDFLRLTIGENDRAVVRESLADLVQQLRVFAMGENSFSSRKSKVDKGLRIAAVSRLIPFPCSLLL